MKETDTQIAVIYCRVSSAKQTKRGDGLGSQETRCREFARYKGHEVAEVFTDDASGGLIDRPGMLAMLAFLRRHRTRQPVVIIDDISRLARGLDAHIKLRTAISGAGGKLQSPSIEFGEDSDSLLVENMLASVSQHQRQKNAEQTLNRMRARAMNGYWVFQAPAGYRYVRGRDSGKVLARDEPLASIIAEALEGYASGRFDTQVEVKRFLEVVPDFPKDRTGEIRNQRITDLLTQRLYAGYIDLPDWDIRMRPAKHEPLITFETFQAIQARLNGKAKVPARKDLSADFPLRGFVVCGHCGRPMTACWSKGRSTAYPYYLCPSRSCESYGKSVRRDVLEGEFEALLQALRPSEALFRMALAMFRDLWDERLTGAAERAGAADKEIRALDRKIDQFLDRIADTDNGRLVATYENKITALEERKALLTEQTRQGGRPLPSFDEGFRTAFAFLGNPQKLWRSERLEDKRTVLKLVFADRLPYVRNEGFRTANYTLPFKVLAGIEQGKKGMARPRRFELLTF